MNRNPNPRAGGGVTSLECYSAAIEREGERRNGQGPPFQSGVEKESTSEKGGKQEKRKMNKKVGQEKTEMIRKKKRKKEKKRSRRKKRKKWHDRSGRNFHRKRAEDFKKEEKGGGKRSVGIRCLYTSNQV